MPQGRIKIANGIPATAHELGANREFLRDDRQLLDVTDKKELHNRIIDWQSESQWPFW